MKTLDQKSSDRGHFELSRSCIKYLKISEVQSEAEKIGRTSGIRLYGDNKKAFASLRQHFPLFGYAFRFWGFHVIEAEEDGMDQIDLLTLLVYPGGENFFSRWQFYHVLDLHSEEKIRRYFPIEPKDEWDFGNNDTASSISNCWTQWPSSSFIGLRQFLCLAGIKSAVAHLTERRDSHLVAYEKLKHTPLEYSLIGRSPDLFECLIGSDAFDFSAMYDRQKFNHAAAWGRVEAARIILREINEINDAEEYWDIHYSPLIVAARHGRHEMVCILLEEGASANESFLPDGKGPLFWATVHGHCEVIEQLLSSGADPNQRDGGGASPLHHAIHKGEETCAEALLQAGARVDLRDDHGATPLLYAYFWEFESIIPQLHVAENHPGVAKITISDAVAFSFDVPGSSWGFPYSSVLTTISKLHEAGVDLETQDTHGLTALAMAILYQEDDAVEKLLDMGADPNSTDDNGLTPLMHASMMPSKWYLETLLQTKRAKFKLEDFKGRTPLMLAAMTSLDEEYRNQEEYRRKEYSDCSNNLGESPSQNNEVLRFILEKKIWEVDAQDLGGETALTLVVEHQAFDNVGLLLCIGNSNPNILNYSDQTPLMKAAAHGNEKVVKLLLGCERIEPDLPNGTGRTALFFAVTGGNAGVVKLLLDTGRVRASRTDDCGFTPLSLWHEANDPAKIISLLYETGEYDTDMTDF